MLRSASCSKNDDGALRDIENAVQELHAEGTEDAANADNSIL
jgi:hypothetical protein